MTSLAIVLLKLTAVALPFAVLARWLRVYPQTRLVLAAAIPALASGVLLANADAAGSGAIWMILAIDAVLLLAAAADLLTLPGRKTISVNRRVGRIASLQKTHSVTLEVMNHGRHDAVLSIRDGVPEELTPVPSEFFLRSAPRSRSTLHYALRPGRRGAFAIDCVYVQAHTRLGFWRRMLDYPVATTICVYPDMRQLAQYALLARTNRLSLVGVRHSRRIGQDHEFERLRDYTVDDNHRHIEWRATARRRKLTVKDFQVSQSQRVVFLIDCGRMMTNEAGGISLLDHSFNAMLMLSYVALRQGDSAGMICFSDEIHGFVPPRGGMNQMNRLLHASFDRFPRMVESRYDLAFRYLASHCRRRSLVVLVTNVIDEVNARQIDRYLTNLLGRHLPLGILLRDRRLFDAVADNGDGASENQFWRAAAAADILTWRRQVLADLQRKGVLSLDVLPEDMTAPLVNRYLEIKARHLL